MPSAVADSMEYNSGVASMRFFLRAEVSDQGSCFEGKVNERCG
jgi:hypothetical protein